MTRQQETQADIVISLTAFWDYKNNDMSRKLMGVNEDTSKIISGRESFELSLHWKIGGIGLHLADTLKNIKYCEIGMNGDEYTTRVLFLHANKVAFCDAIYFYRNNLNSTSKKFSVKHFSILIIDGMLLTLIRKNNFDRNLMIAYKEKVIASLFYTYEGLAKSSTNNRSKLLLTPNESVF